MAEDTGMNWKYWRTGEDISAPFHFVLAFVLLPVVIAGFFGLICYIYFIERPKSALEATFFLDALHIIHGTLLIGSTVYVQTYIWWLLIKCSLSETGVHLKPLLGKYRTINWDRIQKAAIYDVYWGRRGYGEPYIIGFLNLNKYPLELKGDLGCL